MATYVLVHGTGSGGWLWNPVAERLQEAGHSVHAPTLVGVGERASEGGADTNLTTHIEQIASLIQSQAAPRVVLVGFSYSGLVVEGVASPSRIGSRSPSSSTRCMCRRGSAASISSRRLPRTGSSLGSESRRRLETPAVPP